MAISVVCGGCKAKYSVADSLAGKRAKCQKCGTSFQVPQPEEDLPVLEPVEASEGLTPLSGFDNGDLFGSSSTPLDSSNPFDMPTKPVAAMPAYSSSGYAAPAPSPLGYAQPQTASSTGASVATAIFAPILAFCIGLVTCALLLCSSPMGAFVMFAVGAVTCIACTVLGVMRKPGIAWIVCGVYGALCLLGMGKVGMDVAFHANRIRDANAQRREMEMARNQAQPWNNQTSVPPPAHNWQPPTPPVTNRPSAPTTPGSTRRDTPGRTTAPANNPEFEPQFDDWQVVADPLADWAKVGDGPPLAITLYEPTHDGVCIPAPQGRTIGVAHRVGSQETLEIWDLGARKKVGQLVGRNQFREYTISPDGKFIAGKIRRDNEEVVEIWSVERREKISSIDIKGRFFDVYYEFSSPTRLVTLGGDGQQTQLQVWDIATGNEVGTATSPHPLGQKLNSVFSSGRRYLVQFLDRLLVVWDLQTMQIAGRIRLSTYANWHACAFSPDGKELLLAYEHSGKSQLVTCDVATHAIGTHVMLGSGSENIFRAKHNTIGLHCGWLPDNEGWVVGDKVINRQDGSRKWQIPGTLTSGGQSVLYDANQLLTQVKSGQTLVLELKPFPFDLMDKAVAAVAAGGTELDAHLPPIGKADWSSVRDLELTTGGPWKYTPNGRAPIKSGAGNKPITLTTDRLGEILFSDPAAAQAVILDVDHTSREHEELALTVRSRLLRFDLTTGKVAAQLKIPGGSSLLAISPSGQQAVLSIGKEDGRIDIYSLAEVPDHVTGWRPYADEPDVKDNPHFRSQKTRRSVQWASFVDENRLLTMNHMDGQLVLWKLPERQAIYRIRTGSKGPGAVSPGRQHVVVQTGSRVHFYDAATGETVGDLALPFEPSGSIEHEQSLAFDAEGERLACIVNDVAGPFLVAFDLKSAKTIAELPAGETGTRAQWVGDRQLLTFAGKNVWANYLDLDRRTVVWRFLIHGGYKVSGAPDDRVWLVAQRGSDSEKVLVAMPSQPTPEVRNAVATLPMNPPPLFGPGQSVSIELDNLGGSFGIVDLPARAKTALTNYLQSRGVKVVAGAPVRIVGSIAAGKSDTHQYRVSSFGPNSNPGPSEFSITSVQQEMQIRLVGDNGHTLWESKSVSSFGGGLAFFGANIPAGKTGPQYVQEQEQQQHRGAIEGFFTGTRFPYVIYPQPKDKNNWPGLGHTVINLHEYSRPATANAGPAVARTDTPRADNPSSEMYTKLLDAERTTWIEHWKWCAELDRPLVAMRWGLGVQMDLPANQSKNELQPKLADAGGLRDLERIAGTIGPGLVQLLRSKSAEGKFGTFVGSSDKDLREVTILGVGERTQLAMAARKAMVDAVLIIKIDAVNSGKFKDSKMQLQMVDMASTKKLWESEFLLSSKVAEAKIRGKDPTVTLLNAATEYLDTKLQLQPIDTLTREKAIERTSAGTLHRANPAASVCEVMLYETRDLITPDIATTAYTKVLNNAADAATLAGNDLAARQTVIKKYLHNWQNNPK